MWSSNHGLSKTTAARTWRGEISLRNPSPIWAAANGRRPFNASYFTLDQGFNLSVHPSTTRVWSKSETLIHLVELEQSLEVDEDSLGGLGTEEGLEMERWVTVIQSIAWSTVPWSLRWVQSEWGTWGWKRGARWGRFQWWATSCWNEWSPEHCRLPYHLTTVILSCRSYLPYLMHILVIVSLDLSEHISQLLLRLGSHLRVLKTITQLFWFIVDARHLSTWCYADVISSAAHQNSDIFSKFRNNKIPRLRNLTRSSLYTSQHTAPSWFQSIHFKAFQKIHPTKFKFQHSRNYNCNQPIQWDSSPQ